MGGGGWGEVTSSSSLQAAAKDWKQSTLQDSFQHGVSPV